VVDIKQVIILPDGGRTPARSRCGTSVVSSAHAGSTGARGKLLDGQRVVHRMLQPSILRPAEVSSIKYRQLGRAGLRVSIFGLGTNAFGARADDATSIAVIHHALDHGVTLIDTANSYTNTRSEAIIGTALKGSSHASDRGN